MSTIPKAVLYYYPRSIWSAVSEQALSVDILREEKGYGDDELDLKIVDLHKGENFDPAYLRINPKATVPTLVVPLQKTLSEDVASRFKAITETKAIVEFLDKSRSTVSRTHTTSSAPAPTLMPATIASGTTCEAVIDELHSEEGNPNNLLYLNARDEISLRNLAKETLPSLTGKQKALAEHISNAENKKINVSQKVIKYWNEKKAAAELWLEVLQDANRSNTNLDPDAKAKRSDFFSVSRDAWEVALSNTLTKLSREIVGPYALGDQFSVADLHLAAWTARLVKLAGGTAEDDGNTVVTKLEAHIGNGFILPKDFQDTDAQGIDSQEARRSKLSAFWDAVKERPSWKKVYGNGLY
ncbi:hypothetical protein L208DRAFT_1424732 [Tricholoma matsutake]|nr:hypothetical protein L208DRAFT_1424732 [Tricholoma matsutake 945]